MLLSGAISHITGGLAVQTNLEYWAYGFFAFLDNSLLCEVCQCLCVCVESQPTTSRGNKPFLHQSGPRLPTLSWRTRESRSTSLSSS
jgi:hypothetical protein